MLGPLGLTATPFHDGKHQSEASPLTIQDNTLLTAHRAQMLAQILPLATVGDPPSPRPPARPTAAGVKMETGATVKNATGQEIGTDVHQAEVSGHAKSAVSP